MSWSTRPIVALLLLFATATLGAVALRAGVPLASAQALPSVSITPVGSRVAWPDGAFSVDIEVTGLDHHGRVPRDDDRDTVADRFDPSDGLAAFELLLRFDPAVVRVRDAESSEFLGSTGRSTQCFRAEPEPGQFSLGCVSVGTGPGPQGSGRLATITIEPVGNGTSYLALGGSLAGPLADTIPATVNGGIVEVSGAPEDAPPPVPGAGPPSSGDLPTPLDGGRLGDVGLPESDPAPGDLAGGGDSTTAGEDGLPTAGVHGARRGDTAWPPVLSLVLAVAATSLLCSALLARNEDVV